MDLQEAMKNATNEARELVFAEGAEIARQEACMYALEMIVDALETIAQELRRLNKRAEAAEAYAEVQRQVAEYAKGAP